MSDHPGGGDTRGGGTRDLDAGTAYPTVVMVTRERWMNSSTMTKKSFLSPEAVRKSIDQGLTRTKMRVTLVCCC